MKKLIKKWFRRRRSRRRRNDDFSDDARRAQRRERLSGTWLSRWMKKIASGVFRFREPQWSRARPLTNRGSVREVLSRSSYFNPLTWLGGFIRFFWSWVTSRPYASLLPGVPALLVVLTVYGTVVWYRASGQNWQDELYRKHLYTALAREDYAVALVSVETLIDGHPNDVKYRFQRALIAKELGRDLQCDQYMQRLAQIEKFVPAMMWMIANRYEGGVLRDWDEDKQEAYAILLGELLYHARGGEKTAAKQLMGAYFSQIKEPGEAIKYLSDIVNDNPELLIPVARLYRDVGNESRTRQYAKLAREHYSALLTVSPQDVNYRIQLSFAMGLAGDLEGAIDLLQAGMRISPDPRLTNTLAEALAMASVQFEGKNRLAGADLARRFEYAGAALQLAPENATVLDAVVVLLAETRAIPDRRTLEVRETLLKGLSPGVTNFIQGTIALLDDQFDDAVKHLRLANTHGLNTGGMMNNLAFALAGKEGADLNEALRLAEGAYEMLPEHPFVLETRGQILLKMGRQDEAIRDLEKALVRETLRPMIYPSLAIAYAELGLEGKAEEYRELAEREDEMAEIRRLAEAERAASGQTVPED